MKRLGIIFLIGCALLIMAGCNSKTDSTKQVNTGGPLLAKLEKGEPTPLEDVIDKSTDILIFEASDTVDESDEYLDYINVAKKRDREQRAIENPDPIAQIGEALAGVFGDMADALGDALGDAFADFGTGADAGTSDSGGDAGTVSGGDAGTVSDGDAGTVSDGDAGTVSDSTSADDSDDRYTSETDGFSIIFPDGWVQKEAETGEKNTVTAQSEAEDASDGFLETVVVATEELPLEQNLAEYTDEVLTGLQADLTDFAEVDRVEVTLDGVKAKKITYTHTSGTTKLKVLLYVVPKGLRGYTITCSAEKDQYASFEQRFTDSAASFKFE